MADVAKKISNYQYDIYSVQDSVVLGQDENYGFTFRKLVIDYMAIKNT